MRTFTWLSLFVLSATLASCDTSTTAPSPDLSMSSNADLTPALPTLTVNNTSAWCDVTVTVGSASPVTFGTASQAFMAASGTTVMLSATPHPGFAQVKWTGVTTMSGTMATYTMTSAAAQSVTACCPFTNGTGC